MMRIRVDKKLCSGCRLCEIVCSLFHRGKINPEKSAIRIQKDDLDTSVNVPVLCRQCKEMTCLATETVVEEEERAKFVWDPARLARCPFNAVRVFGKEAFHCDLCGGSPQCVKVCTTKAITVQRSA